MADKDEKGYRQLLEEFADKLNAGQTASAGVLFKKALEKRDDIEKKGSDPEDLKDEDDDRPGKSKEEKVVEFECIKGVGRELALELHDRFDTVEKFKEAPKEDIVAVPGIGEVKADKLLKRVNE